MLGPSPPYAFDPPVYHLAHLLRAREYLTAHAGYHHFSNEPGTLGFTRVITNPEYSDAAGDVVTAVDQWLSKEATEPFFLSVGFHETARNCPGLTWFAPKIAAGGKHLEPSYRSMAVAIDKALGQLVEMLEQRFNGSTWIIFTTDHGNRSPVLKPLSVPDLGMGVMLAMRGPEIAQPGRRSAALVSHADVVRTIMELAGAPVPAAIEGGSLLPLLRDEATQVRETLCSEVNCLSLGLWRVLRLVWDQRGGVLCRTWRGKRTDADLLAVLEMAGELDPQSATLATHGRYKLKGSFPSESTWTRCASDAADGLTGRADSYGGTGARCRKQLARALEQWQERTDDPLYQSASLAIPEDLPYPPDELAVRWVFAFEVVDISDCEPADVWRPKGWRGDGWFNRPIQSEQDLIDWIENVIDMSSGALRLRPLNPLQFGEIDADLIINNTWVLFKDLADRRRWGDLPRKPSLDSPVEEMRTLIAWCRTQKNATDSSDRTVEQRDGHVNDRGAVEWAGQHYDCKLGSKEKKLFNAFGDRQVVRHA